VGRFVVGLIFLLALVGCASDKPLDTKRLDSNTVLQVVRSATPEIQRHSAGTMAGGGLLFGGFGMEAIAASVGKELRERCNLEDFGALVVQEFVSQATKQIPTWPKMLVKQEPVELGFATKNESSLFFQPTAAWLYSFGAAKGLNAAAMATLAAPNGEVIWRRQAGYSQVRANRERELDELEANDCKLLKEEMQHAAGVIAADFVADLMRQQ
jgi:hypothetical protein